MKNFLSRRMPWSIACLAALFFADGRIAPAQSTERARPRLAVLVIFDQMRGDYPARWHELFGKGGFRRLQDEGAWFVNCHYPYALTTTGPGHGTFLTGCSPAVHGIVGNDFRLYSSGKVVQCATSERYRLVGLPELPPGNPKAKTPEAGGTTEHMLAPTLSDELKLATGGNARVVGLSLKERSALLPAGPKADAVYWFDDYSGTFVTSTFCRDRLHRWVADFNRERPADRRFGKDWLKLRPDLDYARYSGADDAVGEGSGHEQKRTFPHPTTGGLTAPGKKYYDALTTSPAGNELLLELAKRAIVAEHLGEDDIPDLLTISFSSNDLVGHAWGPDSQEVLDMTLRTDLLLADLLGFLDEHVGKNRYLLALCSDHGVCPVPEVARSQGKEAVRLLPAYLGKAAEDLLSKTLGVQLEKNEKWIAATPNFSVYLDQALIKKHRLELARVSAVLADWLLKQNGIMSVYSRSQLLGELPVEDRIGRRLQKSFHPDRCGDLFLIFKPYVLATTYLSGTSHGSPHFYDTHVPLMVFGTGVNPGKRYDEVTPQAIAAILANGLGIKPPAKAEAPVPGKLFNE